MAAAVGHSGPLFDYGALKAISDLVGWLKRYGLTTDDAERTIVQACRWHGGATRAQIVQHFLDKYGLGIEEEGRVLDLAAVFLFQGSIRREGGVYHAASCATGRRVVAMVSLPAEEWEAIRPYVWRGRAAWIEGEDDGAPSQ